MSFSTRKITGAVEDLVVNIPSTDDVTSGASAGPTVEADLTGDAGQTSAPNKLYWAEVDCRDAPVENGTLRLYEATSNPTVGSADAHVWVPGIRGRKLTYHWPNGIPWTGGQRMYAAYVKGKGGTGGSTAPTGVVKVRLGLKVGAA